MTTSMPETPDQSAAKPLTAEDLAEALEWFWNAALIATHEHQDATANAVMAGMVQGFAAVADSLRKRALRSEGAAG